jgi:Taurine catabolism dioxygenase TauD, TfdA family
MAARQTPMASIGLIVTPSPTPKAAWKSSDWDPTGSAATAGAGTKAKRPNFFQHVTPRRNRILQRAGFPGFQPIGHLVPPIGTADCNRGHISLALAGRIEGMAEDTPFLTASETKASMATMRQPLHGPFVWTGDELADASDWRFDLTPAMAEEIDAALTRFKARGGAWPDMRRGDFRIPFTARLLGEISTALEEGRGLAKLSGLPVARYAEEDLKTIWYGIGLHLGTPVSQSHTGLRLKVIRDEGASVGEVYGELREQNGARFLSAYARAVSNGPLRFHTDRTDVVGLLCVDQAASGGLSKIASTVAIHNEILRRRPDLLELLYRPYPRSRLGEEKDGGEMIYLLPIFGLREGRFTSHYSRTYIEAAQKLDHVPRLTDQQMEAIDLLAEVAETLCHRMRFQPGDMQFLNNHVVYHARDAFADDAPAGRFRRLLRLWLAMPNSRALPEDHAVLWGNVAAGTLHGGIGVASD